MDELMWGLLDQLDDAKQDAAAPERSVLSRRLQRMTMPQLKRILTRFAPNRRASTRETAIKYIEAALDSPDRLQDLISEPAVGRFIPPSRCGTWRPQLRKVNLQRNRAAATATIITLSPPMT